MDTVATVIKRTIVLILVLAFILAFSGAAFAGMKTLYYISSEKLPIVSANIVMDDVAKEIDLVISLEDEVVFVAPEREGTFNLCLPEKIVALYAEWVQRHYSFHFATDIVKQGGDINE